MSEEQARTDADNMIGRLGIIRNMCPSLAQKTLDDAAKLIKMQQAEIARLKDDKQIRQR